MENQLIPVRARAEQYFRSAQADNTRRAYAADWRHFSSWCHAVGQGSLPAFPGTLVLYLSALAESAKAGTLTRRISAISQAHQAAGFDTPTQHAAVRKLMAGIRREKGTAQTAKRPVLTEDLRAMVGLPGSGRTIQIRDRALLLAGFAGAFRRSELVALRIEDLEFNRDGMVATVRRSKTDWEGQGRKVGIPRGANAATCPVRAVQAWIKLLGAEQGPVFRM